MCRYANMQMCELIYINTKSFIHLHICTYANLHINKKSPLVLQDGFPIDQELYRYNFPAIASLTLSLGTICSLNE